MQAYYSWQSKIYDLTRWSFLFGRKRIVRRLPFGRAAKFTLLEVGCGTGYNLSHLARSYPNAQLIGLDTSSHMVEKAASSTHAYADRVHLHNQPYQLGDTQHLGQLDAVLFSYSLTMINPHWSSLLQQAQRDLKPGGIIAVTDFHDSKRPWFKRHMGNHHVRMDGHLVPFLAAHFEEVEQSVNQAYGGIWAYFHFIGRKPSVG